VSTSVTELASPDDPRQLRRAGAARALAVTSVAAVLVAVMYVMFVRTAAGQRFEVLLGAASKQVGPTRRGVSHVVSDGTVGWIVVSVLACLGIAIVRHRWKAAAAAVAVVASANLTTQVLKHVVLTRPDHGYGTDNSFPSGHTTVTASLVFAALLVVPVSARWVVQLVGSVGVGVFGAGTVIAGWHYPTDVLAGFAVTLGCGSFVLALVSLTSVEPPTRRPRSHPVALIVGFAVAAGFFLALGVHSHRSLTDLGVQTLTMIGLAMVGVLAIAVFARLVAARVP
jgi:membrane-associated phospholipid phosphatase